MAPRVPPPSVTLTFQGKRDWPLEDVIDDWGLTPQQQESYVEQFRRILEAKKAWREDIHDYFYLRRFLRARSYDLEKATTMWLNHMNWFKDFAVENILSDFYFSERDEFLEAYPQGYHKLDKMGRPVYIQQLGKIDINRMKKACSEDRMLKFHIQEYERCRKVILPICSRLAGKHLDQTFGIMDVKGVGLGHLTGEVKRLMALVTKYDQDNYPEMLGHICIINAPAVFRVLWGFAKGLIDVRTQNKIEILGPNYLPGVLKWVDEANLPDWLGGKSTGTLIDDIGPWSDLELCSKIGVNVDDLRAGKTLAPLMSSATMARNASRIGSMRYTPTGGAGSMVSVVPSYVRVNSDASDGYQSPSSSCGDLGRQHPSGVPVEVVEDTARRYAASVGSATGLGSIQGSLEVIPEPLGPLRAGPRTLIDRIATIEQLLPSHMERLKRNVPMTANGGVGAAVGVASSSVRSAPEGSLLNRVEVLEEAVDVLLDAQEAALKTQQQALQLQQQQQMRAGGCCVVM